MGLAGKAWCILAVALGLLLPLPGHAQPVGILGGADYLTTVEGTYFDFGGPIGPVNLVGKPIDPAALRQTDTIIQRLQSIDLPTPGSSGTSDLVITDLSLQSQSPINLGGSFFDVFVELTPGTTSGGQMTVTRSTLNSDPAQLYGTFDSFFDVWFDVSFTEVGGGSSFSQSLTKHFTQMGASWSSMAPAGALLVPGLPGDLMANIHSGGPAGYLDFYPGPGAFWHDTGGGRHGVALTIPEPDAYALLLAGLGLVGWVASRRKSGAVKALSREG